MTAAGLAVLLLGQLLLGPALGVKNVPVVQVVAMVGEATYLPCDITPSQEGDSVHLILWFREDRSSASIYSVDARERDFNYAVRWSDEKVFSNRAHFIPDKQPAELGVNQIREDEAGIYRCRVEFRIGQTRNSKVNLTVIVPPHKIAILNENDMLLGSSVGPFVQGDDVRLFCEVYGGKPAPRLSWYRNGKPASSVSEVVRDGLARSELLLRKLGRADVRAQITCNATNNNGSSPPLSTSVRVDMNFSPLTVSIEGSNQPLSAGERYELVCRTSGSQPPAHVTWLKEDQQLLHSKETLSSNGNTTTSVLSFTPSKEDTGKRLFCRSENSIMRSKPIEDEWLLEVQYKPETEIRLGTSLDPNAIKEGSDVYFDCLIKADPPVYKVEWRHQGKTLNHNISRGVIISNQSLVLQGVDRKNAGNYTCVGFNVEGAGESQPFYLNVMFAPTCKPNQTRVHGVAKQERASIECQVDANPAEVEFRWTFNNSAESLELDRKHVSMHGTSSTATYTPNIELDYGTLLCYASNLIGSQQMPCVYHIIPAGRPDVVHNCTTLNTSKNSFVVRCAAGFDGGLSQSFLLEVLESNSQELKANLSSGVPQFTVDKLEAGSLYQARVYAYNDKGRSEPMVVQAGTLSPPEKQLTSDSERARPHMRLTPMLSVMIGVVAALLIVAVIVIVVLRIQHSQVDEASKSQLQDDAAKSAGKPAPIQRELRFRECDSLLIGPDKAPHHHHHHHYQPCAVADGTVAAAATLATTATTSGDVSESDEKNPDIIPQQITGEEVSEYLRKRRLVSTIETSPSRGLLDRSAVAAAVRSRANYAGYCTIRRDMPLRDLSNNTVKFKHKNVGDMCTLPRQQHQQQQQQQQQQQPHWPAPCGRGLGAASTSVALVYGSVGAGVGGGQVVRSAPSGMPELMVPGPCCQELLPAANAVVQLGKRESSV